MHLTDSNFIIDGVRRTKDGYLAAYANVARTGIQKYKGSELGRPDLDVVRVYRPAEQVFDRAALKSMAHRPVTLNHPSEVVDAKNWSKYAKGHTGDDVIRDGDHVRVPMVLMDAAAIKAVENGTRELSMGYSTDLKWTPGVTEDGQEYDAVQTEIRANHLALVPVARGGSNLRFGDADTSNSKSKGQKAMKTLLIDGASVEIEDGLAATLIENKLTKLTADAAAAKTKADEAEEEAKKSKAACDAAMGENAVLKKQVADAAITPDKLDAMLAERNEVIDAASTLLPKDFAYKGKNIPEIRHSAVTAYLGDAAVKDMDEGTIRGAFIAATANGVKQGGVKALAGAVGNRAPVRDANTADAAYDGYKQTISDAWKTPARA